MGSTLPILIGGLIATLYLGMALRFPNVGRGLIGLTMLAGAAFNVIWTFPNRDWALESMAAGSAIPVYLDFTRAFVVPNTTVFIVLVIVFEAGVGFLAISRGVSVRIGLAGAIFWFCTMWAMAPAEGLVATALAHAGASAAGVVLFRRQFKKTLPGMAVARFRGRTGPSARVETATSS